MTTEAGSPLAMPKSEARVARDAATTLLTGFVGEGEVDAAAVARTIAFYE